MLNISPGGHVINDWMEHALLSWYWASYPTNILCSTHFRSSPFMSAHETSQWQALYTAYTLARTGWSAWILFFWWWPFAETCWFNMQYQHRNCWYNLAQWNLLMLGWTLFFGFMYSVCCNLYLHSSWLCAGSVSWPLAPYMLLLF